jgi:hypothetical protein
MTVERQIIEVPENQISTKRGFPVYRTNPSVPQSNALPTRTKRINVPGGKGSVIVDNTTGEVKGLGGMGFWWEEEVDTTRFVKLFLDGIKQAAAAVRNADDKTVESDKQSVLDSRLAMAGESKDDRGKEDHDMDRE